MMIDTLAVIGAAFVAFAIALLFLALLAAKWGGWGES